MKQMRVIVQATHEGHPIRHRDECGSCHFLCFINTPVIIMNKAGTTALSKIADHVAIG